MAGSSAPVLPALPLPSPALVGDRVDERRAASSICCLGCKQGASFGAGKEAGPALRSRALLKRAADGRAGSCPAPMGSRWLLPAARTGRAGERSRLRPAFGFFPPAQGRGTRGRCSPAELIGSRWRERLGVRAKGLLLCERGGRGGIIQVQPSCTSGKRRTCMKVKCAFSVACRRVPALV